MASSQVERVVPFNLLTAPTNVRIVVDAHIDCSSGNNSNETNSTYLEINEAMNIDSLIRDARKKRKTIARAVNVASTTTAKQVFNDVFNGVFSDAWTKNAAID